ncbi:TPA: hypothetical protein ACHS94_005183 [Citrobacter freundii]|uniref:hypothetical protein n=1 Tax=Citrobacter freundii TaxID=546 RepID=UPI001B8394C5|nr:hypothetical protein [Citrobacter freundii]HBC2003211.1 hypothetical protein [Citrobacter freundii]HBM9448470.1 hypothetical protein [Citrobacter freundii]HCC4675248.1 hypothetical protein [Citrobacter freundii]HCC4806920.1 hypothetical protein [Citrobacter freundii]
MLYGAVPGCLSPRLLSGSCISPHYKTFRLHPIAVHPEPAWCPTHGLLSRRSTDRISTSPLANFAQLSMFRFDGLTIAKAII